MLTLQVSRYCILPLHGGKQASRVEWESRAGFMTRKSAGEKETEKAWDDKRFDYWTVIARGVTWFRKGRQVLDNRCPDRQNSANFAFPMNARC